MPKKKSVASLNTRGAFIVGASSVIRWDDVMTINNTDIKISKAVELGIKYDIEIARKLRKDLKSKDGLLVTFPMGMFMDKLQRMEAVRGGEEGAGQRLLDVVKPDDETN